MSILVLCRWMFWVLVLIVWGSCAMFGFGIFVGVGWGVGSWGVSEGL